MIRRLKRRFVLLSALSLFALLTVLVASMNLINYTSTVADMDEILELLSQNRGTFPDFEADMTSDGTLPPHLSPELPYESRFFSVLKDGKTGMIYTDVSRIASVDSETALSYAECAMQEKATGGFIDHFRYLRVVEGESTRMIFLDCTRQLDSVQRFLTFGVLISLIGYGILLLVILFFSGRIVRPIAESYEKQKRFVTDAGHEIKTPLTVISANVELLQEELGDHESLRDIARQTRRLTALTSDLVALSRMEETEHAPIHVSFPISEIAEETAEGFQVLSQAQGKRLATDIRSLLTVKGDVASITRLVSILLDNAVKYTPEGGEILLSLEESGRAVILCVQNTLPDAGETINTERLFDRFYRADPSRNSQSGGYGIGLSLARAIVQAHNGKILANVCDGVFRITVTLPIS